MAFKQGNGFQNLCEYLIFLISKLFCILLQNKSIDQIVDSKHVNEN